MWLIYAICSRLLSKAIILNCNIIDHYNYIILNKLSTFFIILFDFREEIDAHNKRLKKNEPKYEVKDSLVLKLRDRSIDLASFTDSTAMYPICRAWIKNDPLSARYLEIFFSKLEVDIFNILDN